MADQTTTAETGTHSNPATAYIVEATKGVFVNDSLTRAVVLNSKLEKASRGVMLALATYANVQHHRAWASVPNLARRAGYSQRTTQQQLRELERLGYIQSIKDEVTRVTTTYQIVTQKLVQELCGTAAGPSSVAPAKTAPGGEKAAPGGEILAPGGVKSSHPKKEGIEEGFEQEKEKGETHAHATPLASRTTEPTFPALPPSIFENLPALNSPAVARSTTLPTCTAAAPATTTLPTSASSNATATATAHPQAATPAPSVDTLIDLPPAPSNSATSSNTAADTAPALPAPVAAQPEATPATAADVLPAQTVGQINAQRARNGKGKLTQKDLATLAAEAAAACITPAQAAAWMLAKPTRNFFKADWYKPASAPAPAAAAEEPSIDAKRAAATLASMIPPAPQTDEEKAAAAQAAAAAKERIHQIVAEAKQSAPAPAPAPAPVAAPAQPATAPSAHDLAVAHQLAQRCADSNRTSGNVAALFTGTSAAPITTAPAAPSIATGFLPEVGPKGAHARIVNRALRGEIVSSLPLKMACQVCGLNFADVKARSASARATATA